MKKGQQLEKLLTDSCDRQGILCQRLKDTIALQAKNCNPSDFILFDGTTMLYLESKDALDRLPLKNLRQIPEMQKLPKVNNLEKAFLIRLTKRSTGQRITRYIPLRDLLALIKEVQLRGRKSLNFTDLEPYQTVRAYRPKNARLDRYDISQMMMVARVRSVPAAKRSIEPLNSSLLAAM